jgi:hypothetical protein
LVITNHCQRVEQGLGVDPINAKPQFFGFESCKLKQMAFVESVVHDVQGDQKCDLSLGWPPEVLEPRVIAARL